MVSYDTVPHRAHPPSLAPRVIRCPAAPLLLTNGDAAQLPIHWHARGDAPPVLDHAALGPLALLHGLVPVTVADHVRMRMRSSASRCS